MVSLGGRIYVLGGGNGRDYVKEVEELDMDEFTWKMVDNGLIFPRSDFSVVKVPLSAVCKDSDFIDPR